MVVQRRRLIAGWLEPVPCVLALCIALALPARSAEGASTSAPRTAQHDARVRSAPRAIAAFEVARYRLSPAVLRRDAGSVSGWCDAVGDAWRRLSLAGRRIAAPG
ncbi:MAG TPA: hypothetical protein VEL07_00520 [Planctomycetota bacterium]|nr:hypothetical protein [Planctomycetota bacterium]